MCRCILRAETAGIPPIRCIGVRRKRGAHTGSAEVCAEKVELLRVERAGRNTVFFARRDFSGGG
jgi:hypothetical protein